MMSESNSRFQFLIDKTAKRINMVICIKVEIVQLLCEKLQELWRKMSYY